MKDISRPTTLSFFSRVLELESGESRLQHYGLFDAAADSTDDAAAQLALAQRRFAERLRELAECAGAAASILIVGDTLLPLARAMAADHSISWIGSQALLGEGSEETSSFRYAGNDFVASVEPVAVDVLIHEGSIRYMDQLAILSKSRDLIGGSGRLILFGEFLLDDSRIEYSALPNLSSFERLSKRLGFGQLESVDLSSSATRTLQLLSPLLTRHGPAIAAEGSFDDETQRLLWEEFEVMRREFDTGRRGFQLFVLSRERAADQEWADAEFGDKNSFRPAEVAELFEKSFEVAFDERLWHWKYTLGDGKCVVARLDKRSPIVAHYGGAPRRISYFGKSSMAIQPCDVMVHPSIRKQYGKGSLFFELAATFLEREIGNTVNHLLGFGFPNQKAMNISKRLGLYEKTDDFIEIVYPPAVAAAQSRRFAVEDYDPGDEACRAALDRLWSAMREDYVEGIIGIRDADYIDYRYIRHPFAETDQYRCVLVTDTASREAVAFAVLKRHADGRLLMDLICPVAFMKQAIVVLNQCVSEEVPGATLRAWVTGSGREKLSIAGEIVNDLGIEIPCNSWNPGPSAELLYGAWWLTAGDMDFV